LCMRRSQSSPPFPYTTLFRSASLAHHGFRRIILVNGHRVANVPPLAIAAVRATQSTQALVVVADLALLAHGEYTSSMNSGGGPRSEEHTSELQSRENLVCRLL